MTDPLATFPVSALEDLERKVGEALIKRDSSKLNFLGHGEISAVLGITLDGVGYACKRLPPFPSAAVYETYAASVIDYVGKLRAAGVAVAPTKLWPVTGRNGLVGYVVQPTYPEETLGHKILHQLDDAGAAQLCQRLIELVNGAVSPTLGLDAQLSNWVWRDGELTYFDINTPMMRDAQGRDLLDTELFLKSVPAMLRFVVRRFYLQDILDKFFDPRRVFLDFLGNLIKEGLEHRIAGFLDQINPTISQPLTLEDARAYYKDDASTWALIQFFRRLERGGRRLMGKPAEFLLPPKIDRKV